MNRPLTFEECLREEFLINTDNYPKEYHKLFSDKFNRAKRRFEEQKSVEQINRQDLDYQQDNEQWNFADKNWSIFYATFMKLVNGKKVEDYELDFLKKYAGKYLQRQKYIKDEELIEKLADDFIKAGHYDDKGFKGAFIAGAKQYAASQVNNNVEDKWISANLYGAPKEKGVFFIKYNGGIDKEVGDKIAIKELVENGWEDVYYLPNEGVIN